MSPTSLSWASVNVGGIGAQKAVTLTNGGSISISINSVTLTGANPGDYRMYSNTCTSTLGAGASCSLKVAFAPTTGGTRTASLTFSDSASNSPQNVALSGYAPGGTAGSVNINPTSLSFGSINVGSTSTAQSATLTNSTSSSITINGIAVTGTDPGDFVISSETCGSSLGASASCSISVAFKPSVSGSRAATLTVSDTASNSPQTVALSGSGGSSSGGSASVSPTSLSWASVNVGGIGAQKAVTLTNAGSTSITLSSVTLTGANPGDYRMYSNTCTSTLAAGANCSVKVAFAPTTGGTRTASLTFSDSASDSPQNVALSGYAPGGSSGSVTVSPTALGFPATAVGSTSAAQTATLTNSTSSSISISSVAIGGADPGDFAISSKTCGTSLAASASCSASVVFKPTVSGTRTATLSFSDSGSGSPQTVTLSGAGPSAAFEIEPTNPTVVVNEALQFSATTAVTWSATCGSIASTSGLYNAPSSTGTCTVTATEIGGTHATVSTAVKVTSSPSSGTLEIYPTSAAVYAGAQQIYQAQLSTIPDGHSLAYSVDGVVGGNATVGIITNEGVYTAPAAAGKHTITLKDNSLGTSVSGSATVYTNVAVDFASRTSSHSIPSHLFGAERMDSLRSTADIDLVEAGGITYARFYALIPTVFATQTPNWAPIDAAVQRISAGGVKVMLQMYQTPPWLQPNPNPCGTGNTSVPPTDNTRWGQMAAQYIQHIDSKFPGVVTDYEIWNEPDTAALCTAASNRESVYLALYKTAAPIMRAQVKADGSSARVGGPATAGVPASWISAMLSDPVMSQNIDFLSYHIYPFSNTQLGAQWDTYNGVVSVLQSTQNSGLGPLNYYLNAARVVAAGKQPQGKNLPIYNSEYNIDWDYAKTCCQNDPTYSPVWNGLFEAGGLDAVYSGAANVMQHMVYFAATAHPYFCLIGEINANMDCTYSTSPAPYPQYFLYQLFGSPTYLGLQNGGAMANSIAPGYLGNGLVTTAFYTSSLDAIVLINPSGTTLNNVPINVSNTGISSASATLYQIVNGQSIESSGLSLRSTGGTSYSTSVTLQPYSVQAISIHH